MSWRPASQIKLVSGWLGGCLLGASLPLMLMQQGPLVASLIASLPLWPLVLLAMIGALLGAVALSPTQEKDAPNGY